MMRLGPTELCDKERLDVALTVIGEGLHYCRDHKEQLRGTPKSVEKIKVYADNWRLEQALKLVAGYMNRRLKRTHNPRSGSPRNFGSIT